MSGRRQTAVVSRRDVTRMLGGAFVLSVCGARSALAQACPALPTVGQVRVSNLVLLINGTRFSACHIKRPTLPGLSVVVSPNAKGGLTACTLELAGITIDAELTLSAVPGASKPYCGTFGFVQFAQYVDQRSPSGLGAGGGGYACAQSSGWELDSGGPSQTYNGLRSCNLGRNRKSMTDAPGVATEDANTAYDMVWVGRFAPPPAAPGTAIAPNRFRTWVVWITTDDSRPPSRVNPLRRHPLGRVDWAWQGQAGNNGPASSCPSAVPHPGTGWDAKYNTGSVTAVLFGNAAGAPPKKFMRAHNNAWVPGQC